MRATRAARAEGVVDEADLVWVGAVASGMDADDVLDGCDVAGLARVAAGCERAGTAVDQAAAAFVGIARERPFPRANGAAAWLAAAHVLAGRSLVLRAADGDVLSLLAAARSGAAGQAAVADALTTWAAPRSGALRRMRGWLRWLSPVPPAELWGAAVPVAWSCPVCGRRLRQPERDVRGMPMAWVTASPFELTARCWYEHRAHRRDGRPFAPAPGANGQDGSRRCPVVACGPTGRAGSFCALTGGGGLLFLAEPGGARYRVVALRELAASDLVGSPGSWERLVERGDERGRVGADAVRLDAEGLSIDLDALALDAVGAPATCVGV